MMFPRGWAARASLATALVWTGLVTSEAVAKAANSKCEGTEVPGKDLPTPVEPYPLNAAGWGPEAGNGLQFSRWAEDWTGMRTEGKAPVFKAIPLGASASLTLNAEARLRYDVYANAQLIPRNDYDQGLLRMVVGADWRLNPNLRLYSEIATGQRAGRKGTASANFQNDASLQQAFIDVRGHFAGSVTGLMIGRQEFADGPRQLISLSDGPNIRRTWNGVRLYVHGHKFRLGAFDLRATQLGSGSFDEKPSHAERLYGLNASFIVSSGKEPNTYLDPFWLHTTTPAFSSGGHTGIDTRDTYGARLWGRRGDLRFDWTLARQTGEYMGRQIDAWGLFAVQSHSLSSKGWKPRLTAHIDVASGGGNGAGDLKGFNPLYASSNYLGEGRFLSLTNLLMIAPGIAVSPLKSFSISAEYGFARRLNDGDAAYAGWMRAYTGTQHVHGSEIGGLLRVVGIYSVNERLTLTVNYEHFDVGDVLKRAQFPTGAYAYVGSIFRY